MTPDDIAERIAGRSRGLPLFDANDYVAAHPDLAQVDATEHFGRHGAWEGRTLILREHRWAKVARAYETPPNAEPPSDAGLRMASRRADDLAVRITLPTSASAPAQEAARFVTASLTAIGVQAELEPSSWPEGSRRELLVDPQRDGPDVALGARAADAVVLLTGAPHDPQLREQLPLALAAAGVIACVPETQAVFAAAGVPALWLPPPVDEPPLTSPPPAWRASIAANAAGFDLHNGAWRDRPIEVAAFGALTERRTASWLALAEPVSRRRNVVHMPRPRLGWSAEDRPLRRYVGARAQICLHLQAEDPASPDWLEACTDGAALGAVLLGEPGLRHPVLDPERHYFEAAPRRMSGLIDWLLDTPEGRVEAEARRLAAIAALRRSADLVDTGARVAGFLHALERAR